MSLKLIIRPEARVDLAEAKIWYDKQRKGLAGEFKLCIEEAMERIRRMPELHAEMDNGVRRCLVRRFPYAIFYKVEEKRIVVIAVMHTSRDPKRWRDRA
jgi:plasmid stabilization system protein ParE